MDQKRMHELVAAAPIARLATLNRHGSVDLVPVTFAMESDRLVTAVDHKPKRTTRLARLENIRNEPRVTLLVDHYEDDWDRLWWVRMRGRAEVFESGTPQHGRAAELLVTKYEHYRGRPPEGPAIVVTVDDWRGWSAA